MLKSNDPQDITDSYVDELETEAGSRPAHAPESRSSQDDSGMDDRAWFERDLDLDSEIDEATPAREITMTDLEAEMPPEEHLHPAELSDLNAPGDVDIEELDEDDLDDTDLPADARLDPLDP